MFVDISSLEEGGLMEVIDTDSFFWKIFEKWDDKLNFIESNELFVFLWYKKKFKKQ